MKMTSIFLFTLLTPLYSWAGPHIGSIVHKKGNVQILTKPLKKSGNRSPEVLYEGLYYKLQPARIGTRVSSEEVLQTGTDGKAKIIFRNGDQLAVGPGTSYRLSAKGGGNGSSKGGVLDVFYGKVRAIISKKSPRKGMKVKTPEAVAGVRGTDFYVMSNPSGTDITVLRGEVAVSESGDLKKAQSVKGGYSARVTTKLPQQKSARLQLKEASKNDLLEIQKASTIAEKPDLSQLSAKEKKLRQALEKRARKAVLVDIKETNPEIFAQIKSEKDADSINTSVVSVLFKKAPAEKANSKPSAEDLKGVGSDVYKKYFEE